MPEGPEIRRQADKLAEVLSNKKCNNIEFGLIRHRPYSEVLRGENILSVTSKGKAMLIHFENGYSIFSHNQLYGRWEVVAAGERPESSRQLRLALDTSAGSALLYSASDIDVLPTSELVNHPFLSKLGPDVLDNNVTPAVITKRLRARKFNGRQLAALLLDQHFLAGLGNYLRSEILYSAGLLPVRKPSSLSAEEVETLSVAIKQITVRSYKTKGVTVTHEIYDRVRKHGGSFEQARFAVFNKESEPCLKCSAEIKRENRGGRRLYYCENCQE
ncbi:endonuclease VIII [Alteromonas antoniana]|uniref:endonuclease VIII n=1 Tax=Alteromonas antoniana TaxID=2803813 RepID=UPI001C47DF80